jgi:nitrate reductase alpha subunit
MPQSPWSSATIPTSTRFTALGPLMDKLGNGGKGIAWNTEHEVELLKQLNGVVR